MNMNSLITIHHIITNFDFTHLSQILLSLFSTFGIINIKTVRTNNVPLIIPFDHYVIVNTTTALGWSVGLGNLRPIYPYLPDTKLIHFWER